MPFSLSSILSLLPVVGPIVAKAPEFIAVFNDIKATFAEDDQETLQSALEDVQADNDEGHARLQQKLKEAAER